MRILIADDNEIFCEFLTYLIDTMKDHQLVGTASNGVEAVELAIGTKPDVVLLDIEMPTMNGIEAAQWIKHALPETRVILISISGDYAQNPAVLQCGADAFIPKSQLANCARAVIAEVISRSQVRRSHRIEARVGAD